MNKFENALKKYLDIFANQEMYFVNDLKNVKMFQKVPKNINADDIRTKLSAINDMEFIQNNLMGDAVTHIINLKIDERLERGDLSVVEDIAHITANGKSFYLLHFSSLYCNFHRPDLFPIFSDQHIDFYKRYIKENNLSLDPEKINTSDVFSKALNAWFSAWG